MGQDPNCSWSKEYTPGNSNLPSLQVYQVCPMDNGQVMITSSMGVSQLVGESESGPIYTDFSQVSANPASVLPGYTGMVTISGLVAGSEVSIAAADGTVVATPAVTGSTALWNPVDTTGDRLPTGVYIVRAALAGQAPQAVATVRIVR